MYQNQLKKIRIQKGMTLEQLSKLTGISSGYLCHLERGSRKNPSIEVMDKISNVLNTSISELFLNKM